MQNAEGQKRDSLMLLNGRSKGENEQDRQGWSCMGSSI